MVTRNELTTSGINYSPPQIQRTEQSEVEDISTAHLEFRVSADYGGQPVELISPMATCGSGCRKVTEVVPERFVEQPLINVSFG